MKIEIMKLLSVLLILSFNVLSDPVRVACVGNSITEGWGVSNRDVYAYPSQLQQLLGDNYQVEIYAKNGATLMRYSGGPSYWDAAVFDEVFLSNADIITIMLGTNDLGFWQYGGQQFGDDLSAMIDTFSTISSKPLICLCLPPYESLYEDLIEMDSVFSSLSEERSLPLFDTQTPLLEQSDLFSDGVHPNDDGAAAIARVIYEGITEVIIYRGCTDPAASNYDFSMKWDDGACTYDTRITIPVPRHTGSGYGSDIPCSIYGISGRYQKRAGPGVSFSILNNGLISRKVVNAKIVNEQ